MLANGSSLETVDSMPFSDYKNVFAAYQLGLAGPYKEYVIAYATTPQPAKKQDQVPFEKMFKEVYDCMVLKEDSRKQTNEEMVKASLMALGAPEHIMKKITGE